MKKLLIVIALAMGLFISCNKSDSTEEIIKSEIKDNSSQEEDLIFLSELYIEIASLSASYNCSDHSDWNYTAIGNKPCGGPIAYIAYHNKIDTESFLRKVKFYSNQQEQYNIKWSLISDCSVPPEPCGIICDDGLPIFIYD